MAAKDDRPHDLVRWWKDAARGDTRVHEPHNLLTWPSVALSAYLEAHRTRLLIREPVITTVPTGAPLVDAALERARHLGWYAPPLTPTGTKQGEWSQRKLTRSERLQRTAADWIVNVDAVEGRPVLVLDDVFVTGATLFSYAAALRMAGATDVKAVAYERMVSGTRYYDALATARSERGYRWSPDHVELARA